MKDVFTPEDVVVFTNELLLALGSKKEIFRSYVWTDKSGVAEERYVTNPEFEYGCLLRSRVKIRICASM